MTSLPAAPTLPVFDPCGCIKASCVRPFAQDLGDGSLESPETCWVHRFQPAGRPPSRTPEGGVESVELPVLAHQPDMHGKMDEGRKTYSVQTKGPGSSVRDA